MEQINNLEKTWKRYAQAYSYFDPKSLVELHKDISSDLKGGILDAGCGCGKVAKLLGNFNAYLGIDLSHEMISQAKKDFRNSKPNISFKIGNVNELAFENSTFDYVISVNVLYTLENPKKFFEEVHRVLRNKGIFRIASINKNFDKTKTEAMINEECGMQIIDDFSKKMFEDFLECNKILSSQMKDYKPLTYDTEEISKLLTDVGFEIIGSPRNNYYNNQVFLIEAIKNQ